MMNVGHRRSIRLLKRITVDRTIGNENNRREKKKKKKKRNIIIAFSPSLYLLSTTIDVELEAHV
jgi:hypothetical protein